MRRLPKAKIELEKMLRANAEQQKAVKRTAKPKTTAKNATTPAGVRENQILPSDAWTIVLNGDAVAWAKSLGGLFKLHEAVNAAENLELFAGLLDAEHTIDGICKILADNFFDGDIEEKLMPIWYPDGTVTSKDQWSTDLNYDWANADDTNHTVSVLAFATDGVTPSNGEAVGDIVIPPYVEREGVRYTVTAIGDYGDQGSPVGAAITSLNAPTTVAQIGYGAFHHCSLLSTVLLPAATSIEGGAFSSCASLTSLSLPAATSIGEFAFYHCESLTSVTLPAATSIGDSAFSDCSALSTLNLSSFERSIIESNMANWGISLSSGRTITITASDETFDIFQTGE